MRNLSAHSLNLQRYGAVAVPTAFLFLLLFVARGYIMHQSPSCAVPSIASRNQFLSTAWSPSGLSEPQEARFEIVIDFARKVSFKFSKMRKLVDAGGRINKLVPRHAKFIFTPPMFGGLGNQVGFEHHYIVYSRKLFTLPHVYTCSDLQVCFSLRNCRTHQQDGDLLGH